MVRNYFGYVGSHRLMVAGDFSRLADVVITDEAHARCFDGLAGSCDQLVPYIFPVVVSADGLRVAGNREIDQAVAELGWVNYHEDCPDPDAYTPEQHPMVIDRLTSRGFDLVVADTAMTNYTIRVIIPLRAGLVRVGHHTAAFDEPYSATA